jgi:hypothetical protein
VSDGRGQKMYVGITPSCFRLIQAEERKDTMNDCSAMANDVDGTQFQGFYGYDDCSDDCSVLDNPSLPVDAHTVSSFHVSTSTYAILIWI